MTATAHIITAVIGSGILSLSWSIAQVSLSARWPRLPSKSVFAMAETMCHVRGPRADSELVKF